MLTRLKMRRNDYRVSEQVGVQVCDQIYGPARAQVNRQVWGQVSIAVRRNIRFQVEREVLNLIRSQFREDT